MPPDPTELPDADRRTVLKVLGTGAVFGGATRSVAAQEQNFEISVPGDLEVEPGESATFEMSVTQLASTPDPDSGEVTELHGVVGFQMCPSDVVGADEIDCTPPSWTEYEIADHSEEQGEWNGSSTGGEWQWTSPADITNGETRSFSVTIEVPEDAASGSHEVFVICWSYPAGPRITPQPQLDEQASVTVSVGESDESGCFAEGGIEDLGYETTEFSLDELPVTVRLNHPNIVVRESDNLVTLEIEVVDQALIGGSSIFEPHATLVFEGAEVTHVLPGDFPHRVQLENSSNESFAEGFGITSPWNTGKHGSFGAAIRPDTGVEEISVDILFNARNEDDGDIQREQVDATIDVRDRPSGQITRESLARSAEQRARLSEQFGTILRSQSTFTEQAQNNLQDAILNISMGSGILLLDGAFGSALGGAHAAAGYLWETYGQHFTSPFEYVIDSEVPDDPTSVSEGDLANYTPPFFSGLLSSGQNMVDDFQTLVDHFDYDARVAEGASKVLFHLLAETAREEARAWRDQDDETARQLLADQLYMINGTNKGADHERIDDRFDENEELSEYSSGGGHFSKDTYPEESQDLVQKLFTVKALRNSHPQYTPQILSTIHTMHEFMKGEANRVNDTLEFYDNC